MIMQKHNLPLEQILTYSGTLPLVASAISLSLPMQGVDVEHIALTYSAVIISFLCGIHWAAFLFFADQCSRNLLITSNVVALLAWVSLLSLHPSLALLMQALCFLYLLALDLTLRDAGILPDWFYTLRRNATVIVVLSLALILRG
jgi:hypothetical protein